MSSTGEMSAAVMPGARRSQPATVGGRFDRVSVWMTALTFVLLAAAMAPLFAVEIPAMLDYPNHLARMYLLTGPASPAYEARWGFIPDLAMDLIVPALAHGMSVATAAKVFLGAGQILVVTGAVFLELTVKGRHRLGGLCAMLVLFSLPFAWGQLNFMFGMGLAVWGLALWVRFKDRPARTRWLVHAAAVAVLSVSHLFDLGIYGLAIGLYELSRFERLPTPAFLFRLGVFMASPVLAVLAAMVLAGGGGADAAGALDWDFGLKLGWAAVFMNVYDTGLSILTAGVLLALAAALVLGRRLSLTRAGLWLAGGLTAVYIALPRQLLGSQYLDVRLIAAAMLILPAFARTSLQSGRWRAASLAAVVAVIAVDNWVTARSWFDYDGDYRQFEASFAQLPRGSAVLIGQRDETSRDYQPVYYAAALAAPAAGVFVSSLYAQPGMQPLQPRGRYRALAVEKQGDAYPPRLAQLRAAMAPKPPTTTQTNIVGWPQRYQYLYLIGAPGPDPWPTTLTRIAAGRRFSLYRIGRSS